MEESDKTPQMPLLLDSAISLQPSFSPTSTSGQDLKEMITRNAPPVSSRSSASGSSGKTAFSSMKRKGEDIAPKPDIMGSPSSSSSKIRKTRSSRSESKPVTPRGSNHGYHRSTGVSILDGEGGSESKMESGTNRRRSGGQSELKKKPTFTTCLSYPEHGLQSLNPDPQGSNNGELQRSQRRSKVEAISKLDRDRNAIQNLLGGPNSGTPAAGTSFVPTAKSALQQDSTPGPSRNPLLRPPINNPPFRLDDVRQNAPRHPQSRSKPRLFGIPDCPCYYPTTEEFQDPLGYIENLPPEAKLNGICKIIPPENWRMPFTLDSSTFKFKTRLQRLNSLEAASRAKINFLEQLTMYHLQQGDSKVTIPIINRQPLDLWKLRKEVTKLGGYDEVCGRRLWAEIVKIMGVEKGWEMDIQDAYKRIIYPFDNFSERAKSQSVSPLTPVPPTASKGQKPPGWMNSTPTSPTRGSGRMGSMRMGGAAPSRMGPVIQKKRSNSPPPPPPPQSVPLSAAHLLPISDDTSIPPPLSTSLSVAPAYLNGDIPPALGIPPSSLNLPGPSSAGASSNSKIFVPGFSRSREDTESELSDESLSPPPPIRPTLPTQPDVYQKGEVCEVCRLGNHGDKILLCDGCDKGFHIFCLDPPLSAVPTNEEWFCTPCLLSQGDDYGFEEGEDHSIASFSARDSAFSYAWWNKHKPNHRSEASDAQLRSPPSGNKDLPVNAKNELEGNATGSQSGDRNGAGSGSNDESMSPTTGKKRHGKRPELDPLSRSFGRVMVSEDDVEREFWRLTESNTDTVEIEYGADVHSTTHGSAAPTMETHPLNPYSKDGWNLNNMPILPHSVLRYIKSDISGMTVPWIYIGMMFSAFCWHNEDHYTYSINYMYWGETKTWYGIPGSDAEKFESAIKAEAPELFEQQPSLLYQLVTMMNPGRLVEQGVKVVACDQRPNEFVITFPKAYHCGFNHGINFNEAVNFALPDWLPEGKESVMKYREHAKPPVFSHNELLISITLYSDTIKTALWLQDSLAQMVVEETARRDKLRSEIPLLTENLVEEDCPEEQYQCCICKAFSYLSQVTCSCTKLVSCIDHYKQLCNCSDSKKVLRKRYSEAQLEEILEIVQNRANIPGNWRERFEQVLNIPRPPLKSLRGLLSDGEKIAYPIKEVEYLRKLVDRANNWVERVTILTTRKSAGRRRKSGNNKLTSPNMDEDELDRSPEYLSKLLQEVDRLAFDAPEILQLRQMLQSINNFKYEADLIFSTPEQELDLERCRTAMILGDGLQIDLPEVVKIEKIVKRLEWYKNVENDVDDRTIQYSDVLNLLEEAKISEIPDDDEFIIELKKREEKGRKWKLSSETLLASKRIDLKDIDDLLEGQELTPTTLEIMLQLENIKKTALNWQSSAQSLLTGTGTATAATRLCKAVKTSSGPVSKVHIPEIDELQDELDFHQEWLSKLSDLLNIDSTSKLNNLLTKMLTDIKYHIQPDDNEPNNDKHSCFCRNPPTPPGTNTNDPNVKIRTMVHCDTCNGEYHPKCVNIPIKQVDKSIKCAMCQHQTYDDRPSLSKLAALTDGHKWNFLFPPNEMATLRNILEVSIEFSRIVVPLIVPFKDPNGTNGKYVNGHNGINGMNGLNGFKSNGNNEIISHFARKLFTMPISFDAVNVKTNEKVIFEEWLFKRMRENRQPPPPSSHSNSRLNNDPKKPSRARRPRLVLLQAKEKQFKCLCKEPPLDNLLTIRCSRCEQGYHVSCVMAPLDSAGIGLSEKEGVNGNIIVKKEEGREGKEVRNGVEGKEGKETGGLVQQADGELKKYWRCPCCSVKEGKHYMKGIEIRVQGQDQIGTHSYIDYRATVTQFVQTPVVITLPPTRCILLYCVEFIPAVKPEEVEKPASTRKDNHETLDLDLEGRPKKKVKVEEGQTPSYTLPPLPPLPTLPSLPPLTPVSPKATMINTSQISMMPIARPFPQPSTTYRPTDIYRPPGSFSAPSASRNILDPTGSQGLPRNHPWAPHPSSSSTTSNFPQERINNPFRSNPPVIAPISNNPSPNLQAKSPTTHIHSSWRPLLAYELPPKNFPMKVGEVNGIAGTPSSSTIGSMATVHPASQSSTTPITSPRVSSLSNGLPSLSNVPK